MPYSAPLDGIRAIAILAVLIFHISPVVLKGGFAGVDVFFVLSGFLITSILLHDIRDGSFSMREFYLRRVQRLLPNVVVTVFAVVLLWTLLMPPSQAIQAGRHGLWTILNLSNIYIWRNLGGYWGDAAEWAPLLHTWSLAVEEQFYLFFSASDSGSMAAESTQWQPSTFCRPVSGSCYLAQPSRPTELRFAPMTLTRARSDRRHWRQWAGAASA